MNIAVPSVKPKETLSTKLLGYLEWEEKSFNAGPLLDLVRPLTLALMTSAFSAADGFCQTGTFTAKLMVWSTGTAIGLLTLGKYGKFAQGITYQEMKEHAGKAALYLLYATASAVSVIAALVFTAAFCTQFTVSVTLTIRVVTVALLALSVVSVSWIHNPTRVVAHYHKYQLAAEKTRWERIKEFIREHKPGKHEFFKILKAAAPGCALAAAAYLYRKYL